MAEEAIIWGEGGNIKSKRGLKKNIKNAIPIMSMLKEQKGNILHIDLIKEILQ